jgi:hypothetical protein
MTILPKIGPPWNSPQELLDYVEAMERGDYDWIFDESHADALQDRLLADAAAGKAHCSRCGRVFAGVVDVAQTTFYQRSSGEGMDISGICQACAPDSC